MSKLNVDISIKSVLHKMSKFDNQENQHYLHYIITVYWRIFFNSENVSFMVSLRQRLYELSLALMTPVMS